MSKGTGLSDGVPLLVEPMELDLPSLLTFPDLLLLHFPPAKEEEPKEEGQG